MKANEQVHFIGIGGYGVSAIAKVMLEMGYKVTGSDVALSALAKKLVERGVDFKLGHHADNITGASLVVYSGAVAKDNPELVAAKQAGIPVLHRAEMLARLLNATNGIAVAGAHGKTTTSSMIALVMELTEQDPTYIIGGEIVNLGTNAKAGKGSYLVAEADESDGSFLQYHPSIAVVTNIEADHLENYDGDFENIKKAYVQFLKQVKPDGKAIVCVDDANVRELLPRVYDNEQLRSEQLITYGIHEQAHYTATNIVEGDRCISFDLQHGEQQLGTFKLSVPGIHNVYNALATIIAAHEAGVGFDAIRGALTKFEGAKRRFQVLADTKGMLVVDDYAHHPTEITATIRAAKSTGKRITAVFQPQRFTRTYFLFDEFGRAFPEADHVIITDIYSPAGEEAIEGVSSEKLVALIAENGQRNVEYIPTKEQVLEKLKETIAPGDVVITMGAGDIWQVAHQLGAHIQQ
ncbi:UDP-N-acetylmuramate--L-alanine ligase [Paenibacillus montaniterrae]|uniref:UDP-N-acetylmuramate--L-alanine ligase n=1 Tax=Paenibacillus montaniterrae TaxID=429341 RepID=UPI001BD059C7|nr:UDP-N-acetylmuramate--L-alanine ligase [Paenibacillus montaniterrae]